MSESGITMNGWQADALRRALTELVPAGGVNRDAVSIDLVGISIEVAVVSAAGIDRAVIGPTGGLELRATRDGIT